jgi:hypothetical protein
MAYKTVQVKLAEDLAQRLWLHCSEEASNGCRYIKFGKNPQDVVREALYFMEVIPKKQDGSGDRSQWRPGDAVKVSFWQENADALTKASEGMKKQEVMSLALEAYLDQLDEELNGKEN